LSKTLPETALTQITEHVYWMSPGKPDRPSLCAVVGTDHTLMLDGAASDAHMHLFLDALTAAHIPHPNYIALTHWHWDHIFGAAELGVPVIVHRRTADEITIQAGYEWTDAALDARVTNGQEIAFCADNIKLELPEPREIRIVQPDIIYSDSLDMNLGDVKVHLRHVGGDHAADSCVMHIMPDRVLFLGDCLYDAIYTPVRHYTTQKLFPVLDAILDFDADYYIEGHSSTVMSRAELMVTVDKLRLVGAMVDQIGADKDAVTSAVTAQLGAAPDEDTLEFIETFIAGHKIQQDKLIE
jgi:glyoxylase-like metal-dependent hydrolase (beta-lactamase superfamily II)